MMDYGHSLEDIARAFCRFGLVFDALLLITLNFTQLMLAICNQIPEIFPKPVLSLCKCKCLKLS